MSVHSYAYAYVYAHIYVYMHVCTDVCVYISTDRVCVWRMCVGVHEYVYSVCVHVFNALIQGGEDP